MFRFRLISSQGYRESWRTEQSVADVARRALDGPLGSSDAQEEAEATRPREPGDTSGGG